MPFPVFIGPPALPWNTVSVVPALQNITVPVFQFTPLGLEKITVSWSDVAVILGAPIGEPAGIDDDAEDDEPFVIPGSARWQDVDNEAHNAIIKAKTAVKYKDIVFFIKSSNYI